MPEAPVHKDARPVFPHYQVWMSRQLWRVQPISESPTPQSLAHNHLRLRALRMDRRHVFMPLFCREFIHAAKILIISQIAKETTQKHFCFFTTSQSAGSQSTLSSWSLESHLAASCSFSSKWPLSIRHQKQCIVKWNFG